MIGLRISGILLLLSNGLKGIWFELVLSSKCRWGPKDKPVLPEYPIRAPFLMGIWSATV